MILSHTSPHTPQNTLFSSFLSHFSFCLRLRSSFRYRKWIKAAAIVEEHAQVRKYVHLKEFLRNITAKFEEIADNEGNESPSKKKKSGLPFVMCDTFAMLVALFPSLVIEVILSLSFLTGYLHSTHNAHSRRKQKKNKKQIGNAAACNS